MNDITFSFTPDQVRYLASCVSRIQRADRRGKKHIEERYKEPAQNESLLLRLQLADELLPILKGALS